MLSGKVCICLLTLGFAPAAWGALSGNVIGGGDFEGSGAALENIIKLQDSPLTPEEVTAGTDPVRAWQFHPAYDLGKWIGAWGISNISDPRAPGSANTTINRSTVQRDGNPTGILEGVAFRSHAAQIIAAPANQVAGTATIDFDFWFNQWEAVPLDADSIFHVWIGGFNEASLPSWEDRAGPIWGGDQAALTAMGATHLWTSPDWNTWGWTGIGSEETDIGSQGMQWHTLSASNPDRTTFEITTPFDYYYISIWLTVYSEPHPYFWLQGGIAADTVAVAIDNIDMRLPVGPSFIPGDFNGDGAVTLSDINPFKQALTDVNAWQAQFPEVVLEDVDPNGDGVITLSDINPFKALLTGGNGAVIPEPATLSLLAVGAMAAFRRNRA
ncbi:MAG: PEP-CTERM sorting domain-containing protein [Phycisphaeraceae bacterium]|nr:PEP-CTERM sorting domain-containing protein [Phycisphaeraceae bacterium]